MAKCGKYRFDKDIPVCIYQDFYDSSYSKLLNGMVT